MDLQPGGPLQYEFYLLYPASEGTPTASEGTPAASEGSPAACGEGLHWLYKFNTTALAETLSSISAYESHALLDLVILDRSVCALYG